MLATLPFACEQTQDAKDNRVRIYVGEQFNSVFYTALAADHKKGIAFASEAGKVIEPLALRAAAFEGLHRIEPLRGSRGRFVVVRLSERHR